MSGKEIGIMKSILLDSGNSSKISALVGMVPELSKKSLKKLLKMLYDNLFTTNDSKIQLQCIRVLKYFMLLQNGLIISQVNLKFAPKFGTLFTFCQDLSKFNLWIYSRMDRQKSLFKFVILTLKCLEQWSEMFKLEDNGKPTQLYETFNDLRDKSVEFPPNFFLQSHECIQKKHYKRDLSKVRSFCKEFEYLINTKSLNKIKLLKKILLSYEKTLDIHLESLKNSEIEPDTYFVKTHTRVKTNIFKFLLWKSSNFTEIFDPKLKVSVLVPDPVPKTELLNEVRLESEVEDKSSSKSSLSQIEDIEEDLEHKEGLSLMYKQDLSMLQNNYLKLAEEKEAFSLKNTALEVQALDLKQVICDQKKIIEEFRMENFQILKENSGLIEINQSLNKQLEGLRSVLGKLEKLKIEENKILERIELENQMLRLSNKNLKEEVFELRYCKEKLLEEVRSYETVTEGDDCVENFETLKNSPNVSLGSVLGRLKSLKCEKDPQSISSFDILVDTEGYDNEQLYIEYIQKGEGTIFEDDKIRICAEFEINGQECEGFLKIVNKLEEVLQFVLEISSFPKEFKHFSIATGSYKLKSHGEIQVSLKIMTPKLFYDSPLIKITYANIFQSKFIKLPINSLIFFRKTEDREGLLLYGSEKRMKMNESQWVSFKKEFYLYGRRLKGAKGEKNKITSSFSSVFGNFWIEFEFCSNYLKILASGSNQQDTGFIVQCLYMLIHKIVSKIQ